MKPEALRAALADGNVAAFLRVIRAGETSQDASAYRMLFGGELFDNFADHPRRRITKPLGGKPITSTAAGAYQFLERTWDGLVRQCGFANFGPEAQDLGAVALIAGRKALDDVKAGRFEAAVAKCAREWASLPGSPYGQPVKTMAQACATYEKWGGRYEPQAVARTQAPTPAPAPATIPPQPAPAPARAPEPIHQPAAAPHTEKRIMGLPVFLKAALPALIEAVPKLARVFGSDSDVAERNIKAVEIAVSAAKDAIGARNEQELVEAIKAGDPATIASIQNAVHSVWHEISLDTGGIKEARETNERAAGAFWKQPAFWVTLLLVPLVYGVTYQVLTSDRFSSEVQSMVVAAIISGLLSGITGYWLGTSFSSQRKTEIMGGGVK